VTAQPHFLSYIAGGHTEQMLCCGNVDANRRLLIVPPLFEEMNRVRRVLISAMRALAERGVYSALPDLPGCNESLAALPDQTLETWRAAMAAAATQINATHVVSLRGGCLVDDIHSKLSHWRLAPVSGGSLLKTLMRTRIAGDKELGLTTSMDDLFVTARAGPLDLAGTVLGSLMVAQLHDAEPALLPNTRTLTLGEGPDRLNGSALWLRAEPQDDPVMAITLCDELDSWSAQCGG
jgi:hypothetical protein